MEIAIVKYNAGNIRSVDYALRRLGVEAVITDDKDRLRSADKVAILNIKTLMVMESLIVMILYLSDQQLNLT